MTPIRILSLVPYPIFPARMGGQKGIALFYQSLCQLLDLSILTVKKNESVQPYEVISTISNSSLRYLNPLLFFSLKKLIRERKTTHLLFEHPYYAWLIFLCKKYIRLPLIIHSHNIESERFRSIGKKWWKLLWYYERWAYRQAALLWFKTPEDRSYAITHYGIPADRCHVIPYGVENDSLPGTEEIQTARENICTLHHIPSNAKIILFNGTLAYKPNLDALSAILQQINPLLMQSGTSYRILICGKNLPAALIELKSYQDKNIIYAGFVDDIDLYFKACDIFLNPLQDGGGIKTKLVEALGFGKACVSSQNGAIGVDAAITGGRLQVVADKDWVSYSKAIVHVHPEENANLDFYKVFAWHNIAQKAVATLQS